MVDRVPLCPRCHAAYDQTGHRMPHTAEALQKIRAHAETRRGIPQPAEARAKVSATLTGRKQTPEHTANSAAARTGKKRSPESRQKMSDAGKRRVARVLEAGGNPYTGRAAENAAKTHCDNEHEFTPENTFYDKKGRRGCRECRRARGYAWYLRNKKGALWPYSRHRAWT
jgi:hypothetical protein